MIPTVDLDAWRDGDPTVGPAVDQALQHAGFLLVTGHGVPDELRTDLRAAARRFFALPPSVKQRYAARIGGRGWLPPGVEANGLAEGTVTPPDLKESFAVGPDTPTGDAEVDDVWVPPNVWPDEIAELEVAANHWADAMTTLSHDLLELCADALGQDLDALTRLARRPTWTFNINRYPPLVEVGEPEPGQYRIGPHTDFGTVTVLDREPGAGGLQVDVDPGGWIDAPYDPAAFTINIGDLLEHWTGRRWRSGRHRVLPPQPSAPHEELVSLVFFFELDHDAVVTPLEPPVGRVGGLEPVVAAPFLKERLDAISV
jgi:isopenicillin N synthase-like dioxygenase